MRNWLRKIMTMDEKVVGINQRNIDLVYPNNPRRSFKLANDKAVCKSILEANNIPTPKTYMLIHNTMNLQTQLDKLNDLESFVVKPAKGSGGGGILILFKGDQKDTWKKTSGQVITRDELEYHLASIIYGVFSHDSLDKVIIEYCLTPHPFFQKIYPGGFPDLRIIVHHGVAEMAMLRVPTEASDGKANLHQGAMGIGIDMSNGQLTHGYYKNQFIEIHPDNDLVFKGAPIPEWEKCIETAEETAKHFPLKYLGIDIIFDNELGPLVIEINARPGLQIQNVNQKGLSHLINTAQND